MKKLDLPDGTWRGEARILRGSSDPAVPMQTEEARYELEGLVLAIEGAGRTKPESPLPGPRDRVL